EEDVALDGEPSPRHHPTADWSTPELVPSCWRKGGPINLADDKPAARPGPLSDRYINAIKRIR
ncbi:MAG: hypothetical protein ACR2NT_09735, partial [Acidimicrobiia bacterium]